MSTQMDVAGVTAIIFFIVWIIATDDLGLALGMGLFGAILGYLASA